jgi:hypothetical protein
MVQPENIDSGYSSFQLDTRSSGSRRNLDYLLIRRTLSEWGRMSRYLRQLKRAVSPPGPALLTPLQEFKYFVVNAMDGRGRMLVMDRRCTVADDDIAIGSVADRRLLSGVKQKSHFKGVQLRH